MKEAFRNIAKTHVPEEDLEQHEENMGVSRELRALHKRSVKATYDHDISLEETEEGLRDIESHMELLEKALHHPQLKLHVHELLAQMVFHQTYYPGTSDKSAMRFAYASRIIDFIGTDAIFNSLKDHTFHQYDRCLALVDTLFRIGAGTYESKKPVIDALMRDMEGIASSAAICKFLKIVYRADRAVASQYIKSVLERNGLPSDPILYFWRFNETCDADPGNLSTDHLRAVIQLEKTHPGLCSFLWNEFGIAFFGRYPKEVLIAQREEAESPGPYGVIMYPHDDYNGGFNHPLNIHDLYHQIKGQLHLRIVEVGSLMSAVRALIRLNQRYHQGGKGHKIQFICVGGHGAPEEIQLGNQYMEQDHIYSKDLERDGAGRIRTFFEEDATVILESCSTGQEGGIGEKLSALLKGMKVIAPKIPTSMQKLSATQDPDGKWTFDAAYAESSVKAVYGKGVRSQ